MLQNAQVTAFTISDLLRKIQQEGVKLLSSGDIWFCLRSSICYTMKGCIQKPVTHLR